MNFLLILPLALAPSLIWLALYLRQDAHPEPKRLVLKVFVAGMGSAVGAAIFESLFLCTVIAHPQCGHFSDFSGASSPLIDLGRNAVLALFVSEFIGIALVEEIAKFLAVRFSIVGDRDFDEPVDAMVYLIIAALGFATVENLLILFQREVTDLGLANVMRLSIFRFLGATFLHTTAAGITGYFLSRSFFPRTPRALMLSAGLLLAATVHWLYNSFIDKIAAGAEQEVVDAQAFFNLFLLLLASGIVIFALFKHLRFLSFRHTFHSLNEIPS